MLDQVTIVDSLRLALRHPLVRQSLRNMTYVLGGLVVVLSVVWWPLQHRHASLRQEVDSLRRTAVMQMQREEIDRAYTAAAATLEKLDSKQTGKLRQADLVSELGRLARKSGVRVVRQSFEQGRTVGQMSGLHQELAITGSYPGVRKFLLGIENLSTWTMVRESRLQSTRSGQLRATLGLVTYRRAGKADAT